jgi:hypothetical protein
MIFPGEIQVCQVATDRAVHRTVEVVGIGHFDNLHEPCGVRRIFDVQQHPKHVESTFAVSMKVLFKTIQDLQSSALWFSDSHCMNTTSL